MKFMEREQFMFDGHTLDLDGKEGENYCFSIGSLNFFSKSKYVWKKQFSLTKTEQGFDVFETEQDDGKILVVFQLDAKIPLFGKMLEIQVYGCHNCEILEIFDQKVWSRWADGYVTGYYVTAIFENKGASFKARITTKGFISGKQIYDTQLYL